MANLYRLTGARLMQTLELWDGLLRTHVNLIACGGTALTLLSIKESTKDVDFIVPVVSEHDRLMEFLKTIGYSQGAGGLTHPDDPYFLYQFWRGPRVFTTELLDSPLGEEMHIPIKAWRHIYLGALNLIDLIITKMFRGTSVDVHDCVAAFRAGQVDLDKLFERYAKAATFDLNPKDMMKNFFVFLEKLAEQNLVPDHSVEKFKGRQ